MSIANHIMINFIFIQVSPCMFVHFFLSNSKNMIFAYIFHHLLNLTILFPVIERFLLSISIYMLLTAYGILKNVRFVGIWFQKNMKTNISWALMLV